MKVLNLYACLGGNRYKWDDVANIEVTAVENDPVLAELYSERFPNDTVIVADAHQYLADNYRNFDFIWTSPPCPTHSKLAKSMRNKLNYKMKYPEMSLYQEIIFLQHMFDGNFVVENVVPYYEPLIKAQVRDRHLYWCNFMLPKTVSYRTGPKISQDQIEVFSKFHDYDIRKYTGKQRIEKIAHNLVDYEAGKNIFKAALGNKIVDINEQMEMYK